MRRSPGLSRRSSGKSGNRPGYNRAAKKAEGWNTSIGAVKPRSKYSLLPTQQSDPGQRLDAGASPFVLDLFELLRLDASCCDLLLHDLGESLYVLVGNGSKHDGRLCRHLRSTVTFKACREQKTGRQGGRGVRKYELLARAAAGTNLEDKYKYQKSMII